MKTIEEIRDLMVGKSVITNLADLLRANDEEFAESEKKYLAAVEILRTELPAELTPTLDEFLDACETDVISAVAYAGYLGFRVIWRVSITPSGLTLSGWIPSITSKTTCSAISRLIIVMPKFVTLSIKASLRPLRSSMITFRTTSPTWNVLAPNWPTMLAT